MNHEEAEHVVHYLQASWPTPRMEPPEVAVWIEDLVHYGDEEVMRQAISAVRLDGDRGPHRPRIGELGRVYDGLLRRKHEATRAAERADEDARALPPSMTARESWSAKNLARLWTVKDMLAQAQTLTHDHRNGAEGCAVCSTHDFDAHVRDAQERAMLEAAFPHADPVLPSCPRCLDLTEGLLDDLDIGRLP